jgi:hypothetical protein
MDDLYGGTIACLLKYTTIQGIKFHHVDMNDLDNITAVFKQKILNDLGRNTYESINEVDIARNTNYFQENIL